jgi:1,4-dihydroxy-2-naphthoate octaprenyltransferase
MPQKNSQTMKTNNDLGISPFHAWVLAIRLRTLPAAVAPILVGTALAKADGQFALWPAIAAITVSLLLQVSVNLANDYFDFHRGIDTEDRRGPPRVSQSGLIAPARVKKGFSVTLCAAAAVGLYLVSVGGWPVLVIGIVSILATLAYSGGPYPMASHGLGELLVFLFFGFVAVCGTYYVQALNLTARVVWMAVPVGLLITAILVVNNLRDIPTDRKTGKNTLAVMLGARATRIEYISLLAGAYAILVFLWLFSQISGWIMLPLISIPMAMLIARIIYMTEGPALNRALAMTANLSLIFSLLLSIGLTLSP